MAQFSNAVTPDGRSLVYVEYEPGVTERSSVWLLPLEGERKPVRLLQNGFRVRQLAFSPDGHRIAYVSNETGRDEVYLQGFPEPGHRWQVSVEGGGVPLWSRTGSELFYVASERLKSVPVGATGPGRPETLFELKDVIEIDLAPDGDGFLLLKRNLLPPPTEIRVVLNWFEELRRKVPTKQVR
jgi:dipeptidyl aminopeptidase/acylaminoacyl peptidase